jgi:cell division protein DivIC
MATVLVSFIGRGQGPRAGQAEAAVSRSGYARTTYSFEAEGAFAAEAIEASFFGAALLQRLKQTNRGVERWLLMGTEQSLWNDLLEIFPDATQDRLLETWNRVDEAVKNCALNPLTQELLDGWDGLLSREMNDTTILCRLVGAADTAQSQGKIYQALLESIRHGDAIVMDITHGFRHQPVLASFMVMLLRWLRGVKNVELYYGALEMKGSKSHCPVLKLPLCNDLLEATEAVAIVEQTGIYKHLGDCAFPSAKAKLGEVAFADEMNTEARKLATEIRKELRAARDEDTLAPLQSSLTEMFDEALGWAAEDSLAKRLKHKAEFSFRRGQYFRAIMLLWEALLVADCDKFGIPDSTDYESRSDAENRLRSRLPIKDGWFSLN